MCWSSTRTTLVIVSVLCMYMNGFNLTSRLFGFYDRLRRFEVAEAVPDVYDLTKWVSNRRTSDGIVMGLASVSLLFDVVLFTGALKRDIFLIEISGLWGAVDCIADAVIGFLSANYTLPPFLNGARAHSEGRRGVHHLKRLQASQARQVLQTRDEVLEREHRTAFARQFYHFTWVLTRLLLKSQILCSLFEYVYFLKRKDAVVRGVLLPLSLAGTPRSLY